MCQNHNVAAMYALIVATTGVDVITHQFLEKGHTQNEGDSMHSTIEIVRAPIYTPLQYYFIARSAKKTGKAYHVYKIETEEFGALAKDYFKNTRIDDDGNIVHWLSIRVIQPRKNIPKKLNCKCDFDAEFSCITLSQGPFFKKRHS